MHLAKRPFGPTTKSQPSIQNPGRITMSRIIQRTFVAAGFALICIAATAGSVQTPRVTYGKDGLMPPM